MFEGLDLGKMGEMVQKMQEEAKRLEEKIKQTELTTKAGGGLIEIKANGAGEIIDLKIDESLFEDKEALEILLMSAMNDINKMVEDHKKSQALSMFGGINPFGG